MFLLRYLQTLQIEDNAHFFFQFGWWRASFDQPINNRTRASDNIVRITY